MSHFSVLVVGDNVEEQLQPYHEFECTGEDDQYVQDVDQTEEARKRYAEDTETRYRDPEGNLHDPFTPEGNWENRFWRDLTPEENAKYGDSGLFGARETEDGTKIERADWHDGKGYRAKAFQWPSEGWTEVEVPTPTVQTFAEFCAGYYGHPVVPFGEEPDKGGKHKHGYTVVDENGEVVRTVDRTNPNRKWDWYSVGGRWNGYFKLKAMATGVVGQPGLQSMNSDYEQPGEDRADILMKGDIDVEGMRNEAAEKAADRWDRFHAIIAGLPEPLTWKQMQEKHRTGETDEDGEPKVDWDAARKEFHEQPAVLALRNSKDRDAIWWEVDEFMVPRERFVRHWRNRALSTFAVVKDGVWYEKGRMGWWGMVANEKEQEVWDQQVAELIDGLPDNTLLTVVDCHI
jgi:hypothetical protein